MATEELHGMMTSFRLVDGLLMKKGTGAKNTCGWDDRGAATPNKGHMTLEFFDGVTSIAKINRPIVALTTFESLIEFSVGAVGDNGSTSTQLKINLPADYANGRLVWTISGKIQSISIVQLDVNNAPTFQLFGNGSGELQQIISTDSAANWVA